MADEVTIELGGASQGGLVLDIRIARALVKELQQAIADAEQAQGGGALSLEDSAEDAEALTVSVPVSARVADQLNDVFEDIPICCIDRTCRHLCGP